MTDYAMRMPAKPPDKGLSGVGGDDQLLARMLAAGQAYMRSGQYEHWDKLRYKKPPEGLTTSQWWEAIVWARSAGRREIALTDVAHRTFAFILPDPIPEQLHRIDQWAGGQIEMAEQVTNPDLRDRYYVSSLIQEAITSSQIEGAVTTREIAKEMLRTRRSPRDKSERMILNNYLTMSYLREVKQKPLTPELICELHRRMTEGTLNDPVQEGRFRTADQVIDVSDNYNQVIHTPPPADQLPSRVAAMCDFANGKTPHGFVHPVIRAIILHFWLAYDHPFVDGNGRTARSLFYWLLLKHQYWLFEFVSISQVILEAPRQYYRAFLYTETDNNDLTYFILYHLQLVLRAVDRLHEFIQKKTSEVGEVDKLIRSTVSLNHRQRALLSHALRHAQKRYTTESHRASHNVVYQTARNDLIDLMNRGLLKRSKIGRTDYFTPAANLEQRLKRIK